MRISPNSQHGSTFEPVQISLEIGDPLPPAQPLDPKVHPAQYLQSARWPSTARRPCPIESGRATLSFS